MYMYIYTPSALASDLQDAVFHGGSCELKRRENNTPGHRYASGCRRVYRQLG